MIIINHQKEDKSIKLDGIKLKNAAMFVTDKTRNLQKTTVNKQNLIIPGRSVSTLVIK